jgi:hypothetical protein
MTNKLGGVLVLTIFMVLLLAGCGGSDKANALTSLDPRTNVVRDGHLNEHPDVKISEAYDGFFSNAQWKYFDSKDGKKIVEFSGNFKYKEKEINVRQQFVLGDGGTFTVGALAFNDIDQNQFVSAALISKVYDEYYKKHSEVEALKTKSDDDGGDHEVQPVANADKTRPDNIFLLKVYGQWETNSGNIVTFDKTNFGKNSYTVNKISGSMGQDLNIEIILNGKNKISMLFPAKEGYKIMHLTNNEEHNMLYYKK